MKRGLIGAVLIGMAIAASGCCGKKSGTGSTDTGSTSDLVTVQKAGVEFNAPSGWTKYTDGDWTKFKPSDNYARLAFVVFDRPNESTSRIGQIAAQLGLGQITWSGDAKIETIGQGNFPARAGEGHCQIGSDPGYVWYATVNPGTSEQLLVVYAVNTTHGAFHKANAEAAIKSLRKM